MKIKKVNSSIQVGEETGIVGTSANIGYEEIRVAIDHNGL